MDEKKLRPGAEFFEQLALGLELEAADLDRTGWVPPEEARRRSEVAKRALRAAHDAVRGTPTGAPGAPGAGAGVL